MTDAPESIWVHYEAETDDATWSEYPSTDGVGDFKHYGEYTRTDIFQARIAELRHALFELLYVQDGLPMTGIEATRRADQARAALKAKP
jgi:hypothetical protein